MRKHFTHAGGHAFKNASGEELVPGQWYRYGGNVAMRYTGSRRHTLYIKIDEPGGKVVRVTRATPAAHDAVSMGLYTGRTPDGYAAYAFGPAYKEEIAA